MPRPAALVLLAAAALALAPARAAELIGTFAVASEFGVRPAYGDSLFPPSAKLEAAATACWGAIDVAADAPPAECPAECHALAKGAGSQCWTSLHRAANALRTALAVALEGGRALPSHEVAMLQNVSAALTEGDPAAYPPVDLAAELKAGNATAAAALRKRAEYAVALEAACRPDAAPAPAFIDGNADAAAYVADGETHQTTRCLSAPGTRSRFGNRARLVCDHR
jgi:hypothetical protein